MSQDKGRKTKEIDTDMKMEQFGILYLSDR